MLTVIVTGDNHLGTYYARLRPEKLEQRRRYLQQGFERVVDAALARRADLFLHAGDLFDRPDPRNADRCFFARQVRRLLDADIPVFAIAGNHDSPRSYGYDGGIVPQQEMEALGAIHLFRNNEEPLPETVVIRGMRVCVWGMSSDFNRPPNVCPLAEYAPHHARGGDLDLALLHYGVEGWAQPFAEEPLLSLDALDRLQVDAVCVGHLHARNERRLPGGGLLLNPGATEHVHFGEEHLECGFWVLHCAPGNVQAEYVRTPTQPMRTLEIDMADLPPETSREDALPENVTGNPLMQSLLAQVEEASQSDRMLRVRLKGEITRALFRELDLPRLQEFGSARNFYCLIEADRLTVYDPSADLSFGIGFSFDPGEELQNAVRAMHIQFGDDPAEQEICRLAGQDIAAAYARLTGGAR